MEQLEKQKETAFDTLKGNFNWSNKLETPVIEKIIVSTGVGRVNKDKKRIEMIQDRLLKITGQKTIPTLAKKSIAAFKLREGDRNGFKVTLRGRKMFEFLGKFIHITLPRSRDFYGINTSAVDSMGNLTIGIKEHIIFPETSDEEAVDIFGLSIVIVTSATKREEALAYLRHIGLPIKKD